MFVCPDCFDDIKVRRIVDGLRESPRRGPCDYHPEIEKGAVPLEKILGQIKCLIGRNYWDVRREGRRAPIDRNDEYLERLESVVEDLTGARPDIVEEIVKGLTGPPHDVIEPYDETMPRGMHEIRFVERRSHKWRSFQREVSFGRRFFSRTATGLLSEIFRDLHTLRDDLDRPLIRAMPSGSGTSHVWRARIADRKSTQEEIRTDPALQLGPPPTRSRRPQRMNPAGILAFYGALEPGTCVNELRPIVGSTIALARFSLTRELRVLDLAGLRQATPAGHLGPERCSDDGLYRQFMRRFTDLASKATLPEDQEMEYIPTQVAAEYLINRHQIEKNVPEEARIDAIIYPSAQAPNGSNIVLFGDAALVHGVDPRTLEAVHRLPYRANRQPGLRIEADSIRIRPVEDAGYSLRQSMSVKQLDYRRIGRRGAFTRPQ